MVFLALEAVIFDFDGVLVDTPAYYFKHMRSYLRERNALVSDEDVSHLIGHTFAKKIEYLKEKYGLQIDRDHFVKITSEAMKAEMVPGLILDPELGKLLRELKSHSVPLAVASNNNFKNIDFFLKKLGLEGYFSQIIAIESVTSPKPSPETYLRAIDALEVRPENSIAIEDTVIGVQSAKGANLRAIAIPNKFSSLHDFSMADHVISGFSELSLKKLRGLVK